MMIKNYLDKVYDKKELGVPMTPAKWDASGVRYIPISRLKMTCGGGLGGSQWYEYAERFSWEGPTHNQKGMFQITALDGETKKKKLVNMNYVVTIENFTIAEVILHSNNPTFPGDHCYRLLLEDGRKIKLTSGYMNLG